MNTSSTFHNRTDYTLVRCCYMCMLQALKLLCYTQNEVCGDFLQKLQRLRTMEVTSCEDIVAQGQVVRLIRKIDWRLNQTMKTLDANSRNNMAWKRSFNTNYRNFLESAHRQCDRPSMKRKKRCISNDYDSRGMIYLMIKSNHSCLCTLWMRH